jgi:uncharacterized coiled-coil DUF342 family protein
LTENEIKTLSEQLTTVRLDIKELSTKMDGIRDLQRKVEEVHDTSKEALQSTIAAHKRLDELREIEDISKQGMQSADMANQRLDKVDKIIFWVSTTVIGSLILGLITIIIKGGLSAVK